MKHLFLPYELALIAKEKGFDEPCMKGVKNGEEFTTTGFSLTNHGNTHDYTLPLYQQMVDWFREKHKICLWIYSDTTYNDSTGKSIKYWKFNIENIPNIHELMKVSSDDYYKTFNKAIEEAFKLI